MIGLGDQDDRRAVEDVPEHEQSDAPGPAGREILPQCEGVGSRGQGDHPRQAHSAGYRFPVRPDDGDEREPDEEDSQTHQHAVCAGAVSNLVVVDAVDAADRAGLLDGDQLPVDPGRHFVREILLEKADQSQCLDLRIGRSGGPARLSHRLLCAPRSRKARKHSFSLRSRTFSCTKSKPVTSVSVARLCRSWGRRSEPPSFSVAGHS